MQRKNETYALTQSPLYRLQTRRKLAKLLHTEFKEINAYRKADLLYRETDIPKKLGGVRRIENPRRDLKRIQARIARLLDRITPPDYLFCPVRGRSYITNAARHIDQRVVRTLDIKKYFPNTTRDRVYKFFRDVMQCNPDVAELLANIATYKGHLPTGSPLSPIMAFYAHYDLWEKVYRLVKENGSVNSLYIDDLTISGERVPDHLMWEIKKAIYSVGLRSHKEKTYRDHPAEITGVIVKGKELLPPNRQLLKRFRVEKAARKAVGAKEKEMLNNQLKGLIGQVSQITSANSLLK